ncbi:MAG: glycosyltransferase, partial [Terriglobia bacterium]
ESEYTEQLRYLAAGLGLEGVVRFVGLVDETSLHQLYADAVAYVYPAPEEDFGMGIVEAMAAGTPVIAWNRAGPTGTIVDGKTGYLVAPYDTDEFAEKILVLATDREQNRTMGLAAHRHAAERFSYAHHNELISSTLKALVAERRVGVSVFPEATPTFAHAELEAQLVEADRR